MPFLLNPIDSRIVNQAIIRLVKEPDPVDGFPPGIPLDPIPIQFPPRVTDDTKAASWIEKPSASYEPVVQWEGSHARKITIELTYIVTGSRNGTGGAGGGSVTWDATTIAKITKAFKAYFYRDIGEKNPIPKVQMRLYEHVTGDFADFRLLDVSVTHGESLIVDTGGKVFPLMTKVKIAAALVTQIADKGGNDPKQAHTDTVIKPKVGWY